MTNNATAEVTYEQYVARAAAVGIAPYTRRQWDTMSATQRYMICRFFVNGGN